MKILDNIETRYNPIQRIHEELYNQWELFAESILLLISRVHPTLDARIWASHMDVDIIISHPERWGIDVCIDLTDGLRVQLYDTFKAFLLGGAQPQIKIDANLTPTEISKKILDIIQTLENPSTQTS